MPKKPLRQCLGYGPRRGTCPNLIQDKNKYCFDCLPYIKIANKKYDRTRNKSPERRFLHSQGWRRAREHKLSIDPLCEQCLKKGYTVPAVLVHHLDGNELNNDFGNLKSLCNDCHETVHKDVRWRRR